MSTIKIRPETPADLPAIYTVNRLAFDGEAEPRRVDLIRFSEDFIPELSLVAEVNGRIVGHILFSRIHIATQTGSIPALSLAPIAVLPEYQRQGIGSALVRHGLDESKRLGHAIVIVLGHPDYYPRFGFSPALAKALAGPYGDVGQAWMALELIPGAAVAAGLHCRPCLDSPGAGRPRPDRAAVSPQAACARHIFSLADWRSANLLASRFWPSQGFHPAASRGE